MPNTRKVDANDHTKWTDTDIDDLKAHLECGGTIEGAAEHLCRSGTVEDVRKKAEELGLIEPPG